LGWAGRREERSNGERDNERGFAHKFSCPRSEKNALCAKEKCTPALVNGLAGQTRAPFAFPPLRTTKKPLGPAGQTRIDDGWFELSGCRILTEEKNGIHCKYNGCSETVAGQGAYILEHL
jgi:hypothetical protein